MADAPERTLEYARPTPPASEGGRLSAALGCGAAAMGCAAFLAAGAVLRYGSEGPPEEVRRSWTRIAAVAAVLPLLFAACVSGCRGLFNRRYRNRAILGTMLAAFGAVALLAAFASLGD